MDERFIIISFESCQRRLTSGDISFVGHFSQNCAVSHGPDARPGDSGSTEPDMIDSMEIERAPGMEVGRAIEPPPINDLIPTYEVNNDLKSVDEVWEQWDRGLISGPDGLRLPSIRYLEDRYKTAWRQTGAASKRFTRRKVIADRIEKAARNLLLPASDVAHRMELWRAAKG
jgi:hypothetical protein